MRKDNAPQIKSIDPAQVIRIGMVGDPSDFSVPSTVRAHLQVGDRCHIWDGGTFQDGQICLTTEKGNEDGSQGFLWPDPQYQGRADLRMYFLDASVRPAPDHVLYISRGRLTYIRKDVALRRMKRYVLRKRRSGDHCYKKGDFSRAADFYSHAAQVSHERIDFLALIWANNQALSPRPAQEVVQGMRLETLQDPEPEISTARRLTSRGLTPPPPKSPA
jgi:hypothetical protein